MIPKVQTWRIRVLASEGNTLGRPAGNLPEEIFFMDGPNKALIRIGFRMDFPRYWGREIKISLARKATA